MRTKTLINRRLGIFLGLIAACAAAQTQAVKTLPSTAVAPAPKRARTQVQVPNRPPTALFQGEQGKQKTELSYDPTMQIVTIKMLVQDPNGYFIPNIRRDNFAVYEDGVRQHNATVEVEHAPVSVAVLMEWGGRYQAFNKALSEQVPRAARQILDQLGRQDKIAIFRYGDRVDQLADFTTGHDALDATFSGLEKPEFSELNFYDALISAVQFMKGASGRKAIIVISSGVDTFSKAKYQDALAAARDGGTPVYVINIAPALRTSLEYSTSKAGPYARIDWKRAESELQEMARASGGRVYSAESTFDLSSVYDDLMENLRVRYVITYKSTSTGDSHIPRAVRIQLVDPTTGGPLEIIDADGKRIQSTLSFEASYTPTVAAARNVSMTTKQR